MNNLVSLLALPALWSGREPPHTVGTLLDTVLRMLDLEFAYARIDDTVDGSLIELARFARGRAAAPQPQDVGRALSPWLAADPTTSPLLIPNPLGEGEIAIALVRLGMQGEIGVLAAGSHRTDFPTKIEALLLGVAANQAAIGLQDARRLNEQRRAAEVLDQRVADRTSELLTANEKLSLEIVQRKRAEEALKKAFDEIKILKDQLGHEKRYLEEEIRLERGFEEMLGESPALQNILKQRCDRRPNRLHGAASGGDRHRQGAHRPGNPQPEQPTRAHLREDQLRGDPHGAFGERAFRAREGCIHGGHRAADGAFRAGQ